MTAPRAIQRVLPTLNVDGSRRWLDPVLSRGRFYRRRRAVASGLIAVFALLPFVRIDGVPALQLDVVHRRFFIAGATFVATDTVLLMLFLLLVFLGIFWITAEWGRAWCGWACPQTVYMEFLFRPLDRLILGPSSRRPRMAPAEKRLRQTALALSYVVIALLMANIFLSYFVGIDALRRWVVESPGEHPVGFAIVVFTTVLILFDFGFFREQMCTVTCPYGRIQSVLLDGHSLIVGYDPGRGEPRGRMRKSVDRAAVGLGDCIDCGACVRTCPTGIDIREGLQMECIHCTQCIDACDAIMDKVGFDRGLIRYTSKVELAGGRRRFVRPRTLFYLALLALIGGLLVAQVTQRDAVDLTVLRGLTSPFSEAADGRIENPLRLKIRNRQSRPITFRISLLGGGDVEMVAPQNPLTVGPGELVETVVFALLPREDFDRGVKLIKVRIDGDDGTVVEAPYKLLGPE